MSSHSATTESIEKVAVGQVWIDRRGAHVRVQGFTRSDNPPWIKVRQIGGDRHRRSIPPAAFRNGALVRLRERRPWEHRDAWGNLGPNYGRSTSDEFWDAAHVLAPGERETTLCGRGVDEVAQAYSLDSGYKPDSFGGCWTCLSEANRWVIARETTA